MQYRDKTSGSKILQETATQLHQLTQQFGVPLIINDRLDIALAVGAEGVHLGQDDIGRLDPDRSISYDANYGCRSCHSEVFTRP